MCAVAPALAKHRLDALAQSPPLAWKKACHCASVIADMAVGETFAGPFPVDSLADVWRPCSRASVCADCPLWSSRVTVTLAKPLRAYGELFLDALRSVCWAEACRVDGARPGLLAVCVLVTGCRCMLEKGRSSVLSAVGGFEVC